MNRFRGCELSRVQNRRQRKIEGIIFKNKTCAALAEKKTQDDLSKLHLDQRLFL